MKTTAALAPGTKLPRVTTPKALREACNDVPSRFLHALASSVCVGLMVAATWIGRSVASTTP